MRIFEYDNYREFLKNKMAELKAERSSVSYRFLARKAGFSSPNFLHLIIMGKRNLSAESIEKVATAFKLSREEARFFRSLVLFNQAKTLDTKTRYAEELLKMRPFAKFHALSGAQYGYFSNWYNIPIREMILLSGFKDDAEWIGKKLCPPVAPTAVRQAFEKLEFLGMIKKNESGKWVQCEPQVTTGDEVLSCLVSQFHKEMILKGAEAIDRFDGDQRDISCLTLRLSLESATRVKEMVQKFRKELLAVETEDRNSDRVLQLNFQLFPLAIFKEDK